MFADDRNIFLLHQSLTTLVFTVNKELIQVLSWLSANKLTTHRENFKFILFHSKRGNNLYFGDKFFGITVL